ncbi:hypothetical protein HMPREF9420_2819 [Segatella salivae DSM 15606]|uniref:Uncharacterized protein n=1 Tax=Segatella salivae DSM 15606 TaxID=888832 RepID=E6MTK1_9BACT|nr:hypothetical protein HMPREF9420_2819 [Segatella salivae DSM 15606]
MCSYVIIAIFAISYFIADPCCLGVKADLYCCQRITCYGVPLQWAIAQVTFQTMEIVVLAGFL